MRLSRLTTAFAITLLFTQCESDVEVTEPSTLEGTAVEQEVVARIAALGFDTRNYPVRKDGEYYTVEGDINLPASYLDEVPLHDDGPRTEQRHWVNILSCSEVPFITVFNNLPEESVARGAVNLAMEHWNDITKCNIFFVATSDINSAEVIISNGPLETSEGLRGVIVGRGTFPEGGRPGRYIRLDLDAFDYDYAQWRSTIEHELGHNIGFAHTNGSSANGEIFIPGTPGVDDESLMNGGRGGTVRSLTDGDMRAARRMYNLDFPERLCN